jgi:4-hydroxy-tetrahydrodipicolinate synthase
MLSRFKGMGVAMVTPFDTRGDIDFASLQQLINYLIKHEADYLVLLGTTGEASTLSLAERYEVLDCAVETAAERIPIVAGFGGNNTQKIIRDLSGYHFKGIDGILSVNPSYNRPNQEGIYNHFRAIAESCPVPILIYNVPSRTSSNIKATTTIRIAQNLPNIVGIKEASGDMAQVMQIINHKDRSDFLVLSGDDLLTLPLMALGCDGVISVVGNALPRPFGKMVHAALEGDFETARHLHYAVSDIIHLLFADGNPAGIKAALHLLGLCENQLRLPLVSVQAALYEDLRKALEKLRF